MINTSLPGRLRNTVLLRSHGLFPLFEAVVNAIQSVDETFDDAGSGRIDIEIVRAPQQALELQPPGRNPEEPIAEFRIRDNGAGFHDENMRSFQTLDSEYKISQGGRGVGRLLWLKAFTRVEVASVFKAGERTFSRTFRFTTPSGVESEEVSVVEDQATCADVRLVGFAPNYQKYAPKTARTIARDVLEHCLWYFVRDGGAPNVFLHDGGEAISLIETYEAYMRSAATSVRLTVRDVPFDLIHLKLSTGARTNPSLSWCADNRVVLEENIAGKISGLHGTLQDEEGEFIYAGYLTAPFLNDRVRSERTDFDLEELPEARDGEPSQEAMLDSPPSRSEIRQAILDEIQAYLRESLESAKEQGRQRVESFVSQRAPRYRPILRRIEESGSTIDPNVSDRELELELHKRLAQLEADVLREGQDVLSEAVFDLTDEEYRKRLDEYLSKVEDVKKSDLAAYVSRRRLILDLLGKAIQLDPDGKYSREDVIHNLIMPMRTDSDDATLRASNLWIIDERLAFHNYLASDKTLAAMPITNSLLTKEPDLMALQLTDTPVLVAEGSRPTWASLTVVEIKRPMRNDASAPERDPIEQCLNYLRRIREGKVNTSRGRSISNVDNIPGFCYVIADLTPTLVDRCEMHRLVRTDDGLGFFGYHDIFNAYIEIISFDRLLRVANQRNRSFFDVIGLPVA